MAFRFDPVELVQSHEDALRNSLVIELELIGHAVPRDVYLSGKAQNRCELRCARGLTGYAYRR